MTDNKKKMQAAWAVLLLLWGLVPAIAPGGASGGSGSPSSDPVDDPAEESSSDPASDPTTDATETNDSTGTGGEQDVTPDTGGTATEDPYPDGMPVPAPESPYTPDSGGIPVSDPSPYTDNEDPATEPVEDDEWTEEPGEGVPLFMLPTALQNPAEWPPWMPAPEEFANKVLTGAAVQVSMIAPSGIEYETVVNAGLVAGAGALILGDGPLPIGDAAAAGLIGPGWLMEHGIDIAQVPGVEVPETEPAEDSEPEPDETSDTDTSDDSDSFVSGGETNDSTSTSSTEQTYTPDSGGTASAPDYNDSTATTDNTETNDSTGTSEEQDYVPGSGGAVAWP